MRLNISCPHCSTAFSVDSAHAGKSLDCPSCGKNFTIPGGDPDTKTCPFCGETIKATAVKCRYCQSMLDGSNPQKDLTYRLLCLFFGMLGVHDLYSRDSLSAGFKLILTVLGAFFIMHGGILLLIFVAVFCLFDLARGIPKKKPSFKKKIFRLSIVLLIVLGLFSILLLMAKRHDDDVCDRIDQAIQKVKAKQ